MRPTAFGLSVLFLISLSPSVTTAQQADPRAEALLDCGYVCVFAQSTEPVPSLKSAAGPSAAPRPDPADLSRSVGVSIAATDWRSATSF